MKIRANILSKSARVPSLEWLLTVKGSVPVYHVMMDRVVGGTVPGSLEIDGDDVWAVLELEDGTQVTERAAGVVVDGEDGTQLVAIMLTNLSREQVRSL